ncbi:DinB family protein [Paenibacillus sp. HW567]|uniref:DinB family protein n=1 Tax=Paenibacillus sp. HW567 TaxID=1034769 RepID=UPI000361ED30|nr:DinB family protein [Paenibacillus sp. HW567]
MNLEARKVWNAKHKQLTGIITKPEEHANAVALFLEQHARLYASDGSDPQQITYEDELLQELSEQTMRSYPVHTPDSRNSVVWHLWHSARIEDITMNLLVADGEQVLRSEQYADRLHIPFHDSGNGMEEQEVAELSSGIHIDALLAYRKDVAARTRSIITALLPGQFRAKPGPAQIRRITDEGAVKASEQWLIDYWGGKTTAGLVLMPATRHNFVHLNKAMRIKQKLQK